MSPAAHEVALIVIAKAPVAGRSKTRLCPPFTPHQAAALAEAALADTLAAAAATPAGRHLLVLDGHPGPWLPPGFELFPQCDGGLDARLAAAFEIAGGSAFLVGMDTPQLSPRILLESIETLVSDRFDAVLGPAPDGGYWSIGLLDPDPSVFIGVPMSTPWTARAQRARLERLGLRCLELPPLRDVDTAADAEQVAADWPQTRFARRLAELTAPVARLSAGR